MMIAVSYYIHLLLEQLHVIIT